jgi:hypothetical protein
MTAELEVARLREHEAAIERSLSELGWHLRAIRDERLYRETHETFEDYCRSRWGYGRHYVNRQIAAAETIDALPMVPNGTIPTEGQVRPLGSALACARQAGAITHGAAHGALDVETVAHHGAVELQVDRDRRDRGRRHGQPDIGRTLCQ